MADGPRRFPIGLTIATALVVSICSALGVWQLQRATWKAGELARINALRGAAPQPIGPVLVRAARGEDVSFTRVTADCTPTTRPARAPLEPMKMVANNGEWIARLIGDCRLGSGAFDG